MGCHRLEVVVPVPVQHGPTAFRFNTRNADDIFAEFFGFSTPYGGPGGGKGSRFGNMFTDDILAASSGEEGGGGGVPMHPSVPRKEALVQQNLPCSLEDLYEGTTKKMKISREIADASGKRIVQEILTIKIKPGWKKGTKITFQQKGNEQPGVIPADPVFIIDEKPQ